MLSVSDHHNISPLDSDSQNILEPDHHNSPSFDPVHNQNSELEPDHSYAKPKTIETSELCINDAFEVEPNLEDHIHEVVIDDDNDINVDFDFLPLPSDLLPLNHCRYVVELDYIVQQLKQCSKCEEPLHLQNSLGVKPYGVAGILYVQCSECGDVAKIRLGKTHYANKNKRGVGRFDVNTKLAAGMIHAGIGETQLNNLLAAMNVHYPHHKSLKSRENEVGDIMEYQANASERKFLLDEAFQSMTIDAEGNEQAGINASTDTCWQKKGSGRAYNSLSGVASLIGEKTGKIVHHTLRIAGCRICRNAQKKGGPPLPHNCKKNWSGTAKGMEPDMVVQLVKDVHEQDININELAGDDDSVGFDRVKKTTTKFENGKNKRQKSYHHKCHQKALHS
ncbi:Hypothetical predicted protein [Mytilus galloprovincialis]|uniref:Mutator-like transposase domain-containing protein n=1 Tax=Mytilus galloprovincialis TaxID=29158 RepID=A0A8B6ELF6_MYTGA|nr:Hypothetical predicted protein [Mytilus galloprovincialis]